MMSKDQWVKQALVTSVEFQIGGETVQRSTPCRNPECQKWFTTYGKESTDWIDLWKELCDQPVDRDICSYKCFCALLKADEIVLKHIKIKPLQNIVFEYLGNTCD
jgi:hypothetical protein